MFSVCQKMLRRASYYLLELNEIHGKTVKRRDVLKLTPRGRIYIDSRTGPRSLRGHHKAEELTRRKSYQRYWHSLSVTYHQNHRSPTKHQIRQWEKQSFKEKNIYISRCWWEKCLLNTDLLNRHTATHTNKCCTSSKHKAHVC